MLKILILILVSFQLQANDLVNINLSSFTDRVSKQTFKNIYIDEDINASISLYVPNKISSKDIFSLYKNILKKNGLFLNQVGNVYYITKHKDLPIRSHIYHLTYNTFQDCKSLLTKLKVSFNYLKDSNSLLILTDDYYYKKIVKYLKMIDVKQKQVFLKIMILEFRNDLTKEQGIKFGSTFKDIDNITQTAVNSIVAPITNQVFTINSFNFYSALHLLETHNELSVKQYPYILSKNNQKFNFEAVQNIPYLVRTTTTENANTSEQTSIDYRDVGLKIKGVSTIFDNYISLNLDLIIEDLIENENTTLQTPETFKRRLNSSTDIKFGKVLLLSGIKRKKIDTTHINIPILSKIPYLGSLFKYKFESTNYINITIAIEVLNNGDNVHLPTCEFTSKRKGDI